MNDVPFMRGFERLGDLFRCQQGFVYRNRAPLQAFFERLPLDKLHYNAARPACAFQAVNLSDTRMVKRGEHFRLALEPGQALGVGGEHAGKQLQCNVPMKLCVAGAVHFSHPAFSKQGYTLIRTKPAPDQGLACVFARDGRHEVQRRCFQKALHTGVFRQQRVHFVAKGLIAGTGLVQKDGTLSRVALPCGVIELLNLP